MQQFAGAQPALAILTVGQLFNVAAGGVGMLLIMSGHERDSVAALGLGVGAAANVMLNLLLVPGWGSVGAAIGNTISTVLWMDRWCLSSLGRRESTAQR